MDSLHDEMDKIAGMLQDNFLLSSVIILAVDKRENETEIFKVSRGNYFEQLGMIEECKAKMMRDE